MIETELVFTMTDALNDFLHVTFGLLREGPNLARDFRAERNGANLLTKSKIKSIELEIRTRLPPVIAWDKQSVEKS